MKQCFKCKIEKPLSFFYKHPKMGDGHLGKCIDCTKKDTKDREKRLKEEDPLFVERERKRGRDKYRRLYVGKGKSRPDSYKRWKEKNPEKREAHLRSQRIKPPFVGAHGHHWSYNKEHHRDVIWLSRAEHGKAHRFMIYDQERRMYRRCDNMELLDTKKAHEKYIRHCIKHKED